DIRENITKNRSANLDEDSFAVDALTKILFSTLQERVDIFDQAILSRFIILVLNEIQDVRDDMVKALATVMEDSTVNQDALVKLIAKVVAERVDVRDEATLEVVFAIIIIADYLDSRLSGRHDLMGFFFNVTPTTEKVSKVTDLMRR